MITFERAREKALEYSEDYNCCSEFEGMYFFTQKKAFANTSPVAVLKKTGQMIDLIALNGHFVNCPGKFLAEYAI